MIKYEKYIKLRHLAIQSVISIFIVQNSHSNIQGSSSYIANLLST